MNINNTCYHTIWLSADEKTVEVIDQRLLPFEFKQMTLKNAGDAYFAIKEMVVRGAPLIGVTAAYGIYLASLEIKERGGNIRQLSEVATYLISSRPTAVNLKWAVDKAMDAIKNTSTCDEAITRLKKTAAEIKAMELENSRLIGEHGFSLIKKISLLKKGKPVNILTHCNAGWLACIDFGTATAPVYHAHKAGINLHVWVDETRPRNQGARLTAFELGQEGVPHTIIPDNTGGHLMQHGMVDLVIVGSDRTTVRGDVANKIGTYLKALAAFDNKVPFYVALPSSTIDFSIHDGVREIPIEERSGEEIEFMEGILDNKMVTIKITPEGSPVCNYGFDVTPAKFITGLITERGICLANEESIRKLFQ